MSFTRRNGSAAAATVTPFCKVCYDAGLPTDAYTSHFVKDQPGPNGNVVCPTLLAQKCLICGVPGHTSSYCRDKSSTIVQKEPRYAMADDDVRYPSHSIRLPPIRHQQQQQQQQQQYRPAPRIVYADQLQTTSTSTKKSVAFPPLPNLSSVRRFENDEPQLKRELPAEASPVHSPVAPQKMGVKYNKKNNPFGLLLNNNVESDVDIDSDDEPLPPPPPKSSSASSSSSWASIAAGGSSISTKSTVVAVSKPELQRARSRFSIVVPTAISSAPLLPPISFKPKPVSSPELKKKQQVKKMWGDTDSEDDEEFLKRGVQN